MTYQWVAQYDDGTQLRQKETNGKTHAYRDIDRGKLEVFALFPERNGVVAENDPPSFRIFFDGDGRSLVWTRRTFMQMGRNPLPVHIVGKKKRFIAAIFPNGEVVIRDNFASDGLFDEVLDEQVS